MFLDSGEPLKQLYALQLTCDIGGMLRLLILWTLGVTVFAPVTPGPTPSFEIVPGKSFGPIHQNSSRADLAEAFGAANVTDADIYLGEGNCTAGTRIYDGTPDALDVAWQDKEHTMVAFVRTSTAGSKWVTPRGVRIGTTLREIEKLAGKTITFSGFGWDYGGGTHWEESSGELTLGLEIDPGQKLTEGQTKQMPEIVGDKLIRSDHLLVRTLRIRVDLIRQDWGQVYGDHFCG